MVDTFKTIEKSSEGFYKEKGSKFIAHALPVLCEDDIKNALDDLKKKYHNARHHCYAYRIGNEPDFSFRQNDDGEPSGTAGKPIYGQILSNELTNVLVVVVRYFGGTKLGTSGLIRAYKTATLDALLQAAIVIRLIEEKFLLSFEYKEMNKVMNIIKKNNLTILSNTFVESCQIKLSARKSVSKMVVSQLSEVNNLTLKHL